MGLNPIAYYRLNETTPVPTDTATNLGTAGLLGTAFYINTPLHQQPGALVGSADTAVELNGTSQRVVAPFDSSLNPTGPFTAEVWVNPEVPGSSGTPPCPLSYWSAPSARYGWLIYEWDTGWKLRMYNGVDTTQTVDITGGGAPNVGQWYHLVVAYDGTNASFYVDGALVGQQSAALYVPNNGGPFSIGARADGSFWFAGSVDEVALYTNVLSATDIQDHYQNGTSATPSQPYDSLVLASHPLLYYRLDEPTFTSGAPVTAANLGSLATAADGTYEPGVTTGVSGPPFGGFGAGNSACAFNVFAGDVLIPAQNVQASDFTMTCWFKRTGVHQNGQAMIFSRPTDPTSVGFGFGYNAPGPGVDQLNVHWNEGPSSWLTGLFPPNDLWCFGAAVITPTNVTVYMDNYSTNTAWNFGADAVHDFSAGPIYIGKDPVGGGYPPFSGSIDEVALFDRALSPGEVQSLFASSQMPPQILSITRTPADPLYEGSSILMTPTVLGAPPFTNQWYKNSSLLNGRTNLTLSISNALASDSGNYQLVVANAYGSSTSAVQTITVQGSPPVIFTQPASITRVVGSPATFTVVAGGSLPLTYQWKRGTTPVAGATMASLTLTNTQWADAGSFICTITNAFGATNTAVATLTVRGEFVATVLPDPGTRDRHTALGTDGKNLFFTLGNSANAGFYRIPEGSLTGWTTLTPIPLPATVNNDSGVGDMSYFGGALWTLARSPDNSQPRCVYNYDLAANAWTTGGPLPGDGPNAGIAVVTTNQIVGCWIGASFVKVISDWQAGTVSDNLTLGNLAAHPWDSCVGTDNVYIMRHNNSAAGAGVLASLNKSGTPSLANIVGMPFNPGMGCAIEYMPASLFTDGHARLYVLSGGTGTGDGDGSGWTTSTSVNQLAVFDLVALTWDLQTLPFAVDGGSEMCLVNQTLYVLAANSDAQPLKMLYFGPPVAPAIAGQPVSETIYLDQSATFSVSVSGGGPYTYQWRRGGVNIAGATDSSFTLTNVYYTDATNYDVVVTNPAGTTNSQPASLTVLFAPPAFANLTNGLVVHLKFDGDFTDSSGRTNDATVFGTPTLVPGKLGQAVEVKTDTGGGIYNYLAVYDANSDFQFGPTDSFSIAVWLKYTTSFTDLPILGNAGNSTYNPGYVLTEDFDQFEWTATGTDVGQVIADPVGGPLLNDGAWHNLAVVFDRSAAVARSFVDGVAIDSRPIGGLGSLITGNPLVIGQDPTGAYGVNGTFDLDDLGIWRRALTPAEAEAIYMVGQQNVSFDTFGPVLVTIRKAGNDIELTWQTGTLLSSTTGVLGTYNPVIGANAPYYRVTPGPTPTFYRVRF